MRILLAAHAYPPRRVAGVEVYTQRLARALAPAHDVRVLYPVADASRTDLGIERVRLDDGVLAYELTQQGRARSFDETYLGERTAAALEAVLDEFDPEVVHVQHVEGLGIRWLERAAAHGARVVMTVHDHVLSCAEGGQRFHRSQGACPLLDAERCAACTAHLNPLGLAARRWSRQRRAGRSVTPGHPPSARTGESVLARGRNLLARLDRGGAERIRARWAAMRGLSAAVAVFIAPSLALRDDLLEFGLATDRVVHLPHGLDVARYRRREAPVFARRFGYVGSVVPHKGVELLVEAFRGLSRDARLAVVGSLEAHPRYAERLRRASPPDRVQWMGEVSPERMPAVLHELDCLVVPSLWAENAPLVVLEAFAAGVPVIASRIGGLPELLARGGGETFSPGSLDELRDVLTRAHAAPGLVASWAKGIPRVAELDDHVRAVVRLYRGERSRPV